MAHHRGDLFSGLRQDHGERRLAVSGQSIRLVGLQKQRFGDDRFGRQQGLQSSYNRIASRKNVGLGFRLADHRRKMTPRRTEGKSKRSLIQVWLISRAQPKEPADGGLYCV